MIARSGTSPTYQNSTETVKYVETANTSHISGERNCGQSAFDVGIGNRNQSYQTRPTCIAGKMPAHITAKIVMASAARFTAVRQRWRNRKRIAEINVPA